MEEKGGCKRSKNESRMIAGREKYDFCIKIRLISHNAWEMDKRKEDAEAASNRLNTIMLSVIELMLIASKAKNAWGTDEVKEAIEKADTLEVNNSCKNQDQKSIL